MKKLKIWSMMMLVIMILPFLIACGDEDSDDSGGQNNPPTYAGKRLIRVIDNGLTTNYSYDGQGRIIQLITTYSSGSVAFSSTFSYENNTIVQSIKDGSISYTIKYTLEDGRIIKLYDSDTRESVLYEYENGYLVREKEPNRTINYNWNDGNLENYEYTSYICPQGFYPMGHNADMCQNWGLSGYLGNSVKYLPSKTKGGAISFEWTISEGLPIGMVQSSNREVLKKYTFEWN